MLKIIKKSSKKSGLPPGSLIHIGDRKAGEVEISVLNYNQNSVREIVVHQVADTFFCKADPNVSWINIDGLHDTSIIEALGQHFQIHPLLQEDILNTAHRPKLEDFGEYIFVVLKILYLDDAEEEILAKQFSLILGKNFVMTFQEDVGEIFQPIRERIKNGKSRICKLGADYLAYTLLDAVIDHYFLILERLGEKIEELEKDILDRPSPATLEKLHNLKREMIFLRKSTWPLREIISSLERDESELINETTLIFFHDVYDHTIHIIDTVETYRDILNGLLDTYLSNISNRMNEVIKVLTVVSTIFIPLTFIVGIYGMNFKYMPELGWTWGYFGVLFLMLIMGLLLVCYFRRKKWL